MRSRRLSEPRSRSAGKGLLVVFRRTLPLKDLGACWPASDWPPNDTRHMVTEATIYVKHAWYARSHGGQSTGRNPWTSANTSRSRTTGAALARTGSPRTLGDPSPRAEQHRTGCQHASPPPPAPVAHVALDPPRSRSSLDFSEGDGFVRVGAEGLSDLPSSCGSFLMVSQMRLATPGGACFGLEPMFIRDIAFTRFRWAGHRCGLVPRSLFPPPPSPSKSGDGRSGQEGSSVQLIQLSTNLSKTP